MKITFGELEQKRQTEGLTPAENKQWEALFNQNDYAIEQVFRVVVNGKVVIPNEANRRIVRQWAENEIEPIKSIEDWFGNTCRENPNLVQQLSWQDQKMLDPTYRAELAKQNEKQLRARFLHICKEHGIANSDANFNLWVQSGPDPVVTYFNGPVIVLGDGTTLELTPASSEQIATWKQESEQKKFATRQSALAEAAAKNDITTLRRMAAEEQHQDQRNSYQLRRDYSMLKNFIVRGEKDKEPLPEYYRGQKLTVDTIKKGGKEVIVDLGKRCGFERLNCLLHNLPVEEFFHNAEQKLHELEAEFGEHNFVR